MRTTNLILLMLTALMIGAGIGFYVHSAMIRARMREYHRISSNLTAHVMEQVSRKISLTEDQQEQIRGVLDRYSLQRNEDRAGQNLQRVRRLNTLQQDISGYLTPEQQKDFDTLWAQTLQPRHAAKSRMDAMPGSRSPHAR